MPHRSCLFMGSYLVKKHLLNGGIYFVSLCFFLLGTSFLCSIPNLPLVDSMEGSYLCLPLFLSFPLLLRKAHGVGWKCFQVLLLLQGNSSFILSICEILREELPSVPTAILLPCDLWGKEMAGSEVSGPCPGVILCGGCCRRARSFLVTAASMQLWDLSWDTLLRCSRITSRYLSCCFS